MTRGSTNDLRPFAELLDTLDAIVWEADAATFEFTYVSRGATSILGYPPERWIGVPGFWESLIHPDDREETLAYCLAATRECRDHRFEYRARTADGRFVWLDDVVRVVPGDSGAAHLLRGVMTDATARKEAESKHAAAVEAATKSEGLLRESEERYRLLSELTSDYAWSVSVGPDGAIHLDWVTGAFEDMFGAPLDRELMNDWTGIVDPADHEVAFAALNQLLLGQTIEAEVRMARPDGGTMWVSVAARPLRGPDGSIERIVGSARNVTARRHAEEELRSSESRFRAVFDHAPLGINTLDPDGRLVMSNQQMLDLLGYTADQLRTMTFADITHPEDLPANWDFFRQLLRGERDSYEMEKRYVRADGSIVWGRLTASPIRNDRGEAIGAVGIVQDISDRRRAEQERTELQNQLMQAQKMEAIGRLAGGIAHDFNNVLASVINYAELIRESPDAPLDVKADADEIFEAGQRAATLVRQLLVFSRRETPQPRRLNLARVIGAHARMLERTLGEDIQLSFDLSDEAPEVIADHVQIEQVLLNLALNARDAMPTGGSLEIVLRAEGPHTACLRVTDTGTGMSEETRSKAFEPFFTTKAPGEGTGLGLSMVYGVLQDMRGSVELDSTEGGGTSVTIRLPAADHDPVEPAETATELSRPTSVMTVLVVEDEAALRKLITRVLTKDGHRVTTAANGEEALGLVAGLREPVDLVLTDVVMPGMSGIELAQELRKRWPDVRVLYMSGYPRDVIESQGGIDGELLEKPFTGDQLRDAIAQQR